VPPKMLLQHPHFFGMFRHHDEIKPPRSELKTKLSSRSRVSASNR
jgi:hypothetical protein